MSRKLTVRATGAMVIVLQELLLRSDSIPSERGELLDLLWERVNEEFVLATPFMSPCSSVHDSEQEFTPSDDNDDDGGEWM